MEPDECLQNRLLRGVRRMLLGGIYVWKLSISSSTAFRSSPWWEWVDSATLSGKLRLYLVWPDAFNISMSISKPLISMIWSLFWGQDPSFVFWSEIVCVVPCFHEFPYVHVLPHWCIVFYQCLYPFEFRGFPDVKSRSFPHGSQTDFMSDVFNERSGR